MLSDNSEFKNWHDCYVRLVETLKKYGEQDWLGRADYWVVEDFASCQQKVYISSWDMMKKPFLKDVFDLIRYGFKEFEVFIQIEINNDDGASSIKGFIVRALEVENCLNRDLLPTEIRNLNFFEGIDEWIVSCAADGH